MGIKNVLLTFANRFAKIVGFFNKKLPVFYNRRILWLSKGSWSSLISRYELHMENAIEKNLNKGDTFFDVGSNIGWFSLLASQITGSNGKVFAFEPAPEVFALLTANTLGLKNIKLFQSGIGSANGTLTFASQGTSSSGSFVNDVAKINQSYLPNTPIIGIEIPVRSLDNILNETKTVPDLVKIDVEGYELEVLKGAKNLLHLHRPKIIMEIHPQQLVLSGGSEVALFSLLSANNYSWQIIDKNPNSLYTILALPS